MFIGINLDMFALLRQLMASCANLLILAQLELLGNNPFKKQQST